MHCIYLEDFLMGVVAKQEACDISVLATELFVLKIGLVFDIDDSFYHLLFRADESNQQARVLFRYS